MSTPADLSLAVGDGARRMTYAELAGVRGISLASARRLARRHHWPRQAGNDGIVRIIVPLGHLRTGPGSTLPKATETLAANLQGSAQATAYETRPTPEPESPGTSPTPAEASAGTEALSRAIGLMTELLMIANSRADRAAQRAEAERARIDL